MPTENDEKNTALPWDTYPRPQLRRDSYMTLNGTWLFDLLLPGVTTGGNEPHKAGVPITVPFVPQSVLSGLGIDLSDKDTLFYRRNFSLPEGFQKGRVLLHFDAVDQEADVYLNGAFLGHHEGGYDRFSFDITEHLAPENDLIVRVVDHLDSHVLPYGKQRYKRGGMWYTPVSGIWQSVWLESVPSAYVENLRVDSKGNRVRIDVKLSGESISEAPMLSIDDVEVTWEVTRVSEDLFRFQAAVSAAHFWSPEDPFLYKFTVKFGEDLVRSYFGLRDLSIGKDPTGHPRLFLNGRPYYFHGVLDQGYFPDGIFTPPSPEIYVEDLQMLKENGFNMLRKHIKVEPDLFYFVCDRLGIAVFQDMVENGDYDFMRDTAFPSILSKKKDDTKLHQDPTTRKAFKAGMEKTVHALYNHPSIVYWTIFNEGWGQFDGSEMYEELKKLDDTRFIDTASGWFQGVKSDVQSEHVYFKKVKNVKSDRPFILSEYGGYTYAVPEHVWNPKNSYGYKTFKDLKAYQAAVADLMEKEVLPLIPEGLSADIYTQLSDVEDEINGLVTYDRAELKADRERMKEIGRKMRELGGK